MPNPKTPTFTPGQPVDVLHRVTDVNGNNPQEFWVNGYYVVGDKHSGSKSEKPPFWIKSRTLKEYEKRKQGEGYIRVVRGPLMKTTWIHPDKIRKAKRGSIEFSKLYSSVPSGERVFAGYDARSEEDDLQIGLAPIQEAISDDDDDDE